MCVLADKFGLDNLKDHCTMRVSEGFWLDQDNFINYEKDKKALEQLIALFRKVYMTETSDDCRLRVILLYAGHVRIAESRLLLQPAFTCLLSEIPRIAIDLHKSALSGILQCSSCQNVGTTVREICEHDDWKSCEEKGCLKKLLCLICHKRGTLKTVGL